MNGLEEVQEIIKNFINEKQQLSEQIVKIEETRTQLAQKRNEKKNANTSNGMAEINELAKQITELGNQSQELQNKLDAKFHEIKTQVNLIIDNLISEGIRKNRIIETEKRELEDKIIFQEEKNAKYEMQKQEFYERFGRIPELSENAIQENKHKEVVVVASKQRIHEIEISIEKTVKEITELAKIKKELINKNWGDIIKEKTILPLESEEIVVAESPEIEEIVVEEFGPVEELYVEKFEPVEEIEVEEFISVEEPKTIQQIKEFKTFGIEDEENEEDENQNVWKIQEKEPVDEIKEIAKAIVEKIAAEQTKDLNISNLQEVEEAREEDIITFEENSTENEIEQVKEETIELSNIIAKIENGEIVYKAQISNGKEMRIYPTKTIIGNQLLRDKEKREELKEILINYAIQEYKTLDKKVINKIDPTICEILVIFANKYNYDAQNLIYNYAMSFSKKEEYDAKNLPTITYNLAYLDSTFLSKKEKSVITKICKYARKNDKIDMIGYNTKISSVKYLFKRIFVLSNRNALPEGEMK